MISLLLDKRAKFEHELEAVLHYTFLLFSLKIKQACLNRIEVLSFIDCLALLNFALNHLNLRVQLFQSFMHIQLLKGQLKLHC